MIDMCIPSLWSLRSWVLWTLHCEGLCFIMLWGENRRSSAAASHATTVCGTNCSSTGFRWLSLFLRHQDHIFVIAVKNKINNSTQSTVLNSRLVHCKNINSDNSHRSRAAPPQIVNKIRSKLYERSIPTIEAKITQSILVLWECIGGTQTRKNWDFGSLRSLQMGKYGLPWKCC